MSGSAWLLGISSGTTMPQPIQSSDADVLQRYIQTGHREALAPLVERYQGMIYASALRQLRRADIAEDVTQAVFVVLATKAASLKDRPTLGGWLMKVTRYAAIDAMRAQSRQRRHEHAAAKSEATVDLARVAGEWEALSRVLDESMAKLKPADRDMIVMRYFQELSFAEIGRSSGISEEAARKRTARSLSRLRHLVSKRGEGVSEMAIAPLLVQHGSSPAPTSVINVLSTPAAGNVAALAKGVLKMIAWTQAKIVAGIGSAGVFVAGGLATVVIFNQSSGAPVASQSAEQRAIVQPVANVTQANDAADIILRAAEMIVVDSPAASTLEYPSYPPFDAEWNRLATEADVKNKPARDLLRTARALNSANWPFMKDGSKYLNNVRNLANELGDSALYLHLLHGRDVEAIENIRDTMHLARLLRGPQNGEGLIRMLVATGVDALAMCRINMIAPGLRFADASDGKTVSRADAGKLIGELLDFKSADEQIADVMKAEPQLNAFQQAVHGASIQASMDRATLAVKRVNAERLMTAVSLACQIYRSDKGAWPTKLEDLVPAYLPASPIDPFGDGKQALGYIVIQGGLPDGTIRPLVYTRDESRDGLAYRLDEPQYGFYAGDGTDRPMSQQQKLGQFRDIARWRPGPRDPNAPTTAPLP